MPHGECHGQRSDALSRDASPGDYRLKARSIEEGTSHLTVVGTLSGCIERGYAPVVSTIRPSGKAVIIEDGRVLLTRNHESAAEEEEFWLLPGGGQRHGEALQATVRREVLEETGLEVEVGELLLVRDYIGAHHELAEVSDRLHNEHALELMFRCTATGGALGTGHRSDDFQMEVAWVGLEDLAAIRVFPSALATLLPAIAAGVPTGVYLGDIN